MSFVYQKGIPTGIVNLDVDYLNVQGNFQQANIVYGTDHYPFDNATPNQGFHNLVTTPPVVNNPPDGLPPMTAAGILKFYAFQQYEAFGPLQWSRGQSNAIPTPLTSLHGGPISIASGATVPIIDLAGMTRVMLMISAFNDAPLSADKKPLNAFVAFSQGTSQLGTGGSLGAMSAVMNGTVLGIKNNTATTAGAVYWTLTFIRIE
jgi:hypothetical protein